MAKVPTLTISNWYHLFEDFQESPQQFYSLLEQAMEKRQVPNLRYSRVDYREGGIFSAKREYLQVHRREYVFDICAAPFGNGFFVSWWLGETTGCLWELISTIPFFGEILLRFFRPQTYYRLDTALMFQESVHSAVLEVIDEITKGRGLRVLSELERKPILSSLFKK
jgi:hypothetical protein